MEVENTKRKKNFLRFKIIGDHFVVSEGVINVNIPLIHEYDFEEEKNCQDSDILDIASKQIVKPR
jgi:hypothetical protein